MYVTTPIHISCCIQIINLIALVYQCSVLLTVVFAFACLYRRPSGVDKEFFVQLFVEPDQDAAAVNTQRLLDKMFQEQNITFVQVC